MICLPVFLIYGWSICYINQHPNEGATSTVYNHENTSETISEMSPIQKLALAEANKHIV